MVPGTRRQHEWGGFFFFFFRFFFATTPGKSSSVKVRLRDPRTLATSHGANRRKRSASGAQDGWRPCASPVGGLSPRVDCVSAPTRRPLARHAEARVAGQRDVINLERHSVDAIGVDVVLGWRQHDRHAVAGGYHQELSLPAASDRPCHRRHCRRRRPARPCSTQREAERRALSPS